MTGVVDNSRPPYVMFERRAVEDRTASLAAGHYVSKDVDFAIITRPGSRDTLDKEALVWLGEIREKGRSNAIPSTWFEALNASYKAWKDGEEVPPNGTPIKGWPVLSPAAQKDLIHAGIRTVEDLADIPDQELAVIGTGAMAFKQKAKSWLAAAQGTGKLAEQLAALSTQLEALTALTRNQAAEIDKLRASQPATAKA